MTLSDPAHPDPYRTRLLQLLVLRLAGVALAFTGMVWSATDKLGPPSPFGGLALILLGLIGSLLLSRRLRKGWKPPE
jgi:hypothetical protein